MGEGLKFVLVSFVVYDDDTFSAVRLHVGSEDDCRTLSQRIPAVAISTSRTPKNSFLRVMPEEEWNDYTLDTAGEPADNAGAKSPKG